MKVFIDTNLVLDVLAQREPFYTTSAQIWELIENGELNGYLSATSITDIFYILKKHLGSDKAYDSLDKLLIVFDIASVTTADIRKALKFGLKDFEDSLQLACAEKTGAEHLITRNKKDSTAETKVKILDPEEFLLYLDTEDI